MLRNLLIAIVASTGGLLAIGTIFLARDRARPEPGGVIAGEQQGASVRSSAGGVAPGPAGTTTITSGQLERGASAAGLPAGVPTGSPAAQPALPMPMPPFEQPAPHTHVAPQAPPPNQVRGAPAPTPMAAPQMAAPPGPPPGTPQPGAPQPATPQPGAPSTAAPSPIMGVSPMGAPPHVAGAPAFPSAPPRAQQQQPQRTPPPQGAGPFTTEPSPFNASSFSPNPEAGAGPFVTDPSQAPR